MNGIIGKKIGMAQLFIDGKAIPSTAMRVGPCVVVQRKTVEKDNYSAVQLGFEEERIPSRLNKAIQGHFNKKEIKPMKNLREFKVGATDDHKTGEIIDVDIFKIGEYVNIIGVTKGKGFAGGVKRWGYRGGVGSHGSMFHRAPGSIGSSSDPSRVFKGVHMPGRLGGVQYTVKNLEIVNIDKNNNTLFVKGAVPGANGGLIIVIKTGKVKKASLLSVKSKAEAKEKARKPVAKAKA
ncbi:MAG: 50S ribosomal protein L3 [Candidatus Firestonebacteria bacterium]